MPQDPAVKTIKMKQGDSRVRTRAHLTAILWWDKGDICMLMNIQEVREKGNFCNVGRKATKPRIVTDYNHHMGYVDRGDNSKQLLHQPPHSRVNEKNCSFIC